MATRRRVIDLGKSAPALSVIRRRRVPGAATPESSTGRVVHMVDGDEFAIKLLKATPGAVDRHRNSGHIHISTLLTGCLRKIAITERYNISFPSSVITDSLGVTFAQGNAIHDYVKKQFMRGHADKLFGRWSCLCGQTITEPMLRSDIPSRYCASCSLKPSLYTEMELIDEDYGIVGSPDIVLFMPGMKAYYPVEIKSLAHETWREIVRPVPDHVLQVVFYWYLLQRSGYSLFDQESILYVTKGFNYKTPYKEFTVNPHTHLPRLNEYLEEAKILKQFRDSSGPLPARKVCSSIGCKSAKECHVAVTCFNLPE